MNSLGLATMFAAAISFVVAPAAAVFGEPATQAPPQTQTPDAVIEVVGDKKKFDIAVAGHSLIVLVKKGTIARVNAIATDVAGGMVRSTAVRFDHIEGSFTEGTSVSLPMKIETAGFRHLGPGSYDLTGLIEAHEAGGRSLVTTPFTLTLVRVERQLMPQTSPVPLSVRRWVPFTSVTSTHCVQLRIAPRGRVEAIEVESGELYAGAGTKVVTEGAGVTGRFGSCPSSEGAGKPAALVNAPSELPLEASTSQDAGVAGNPAGGPGSDLLIPPLVITSTLPGRFATASASLRMSGPDIKTNTDVSVQFYSKDVLLWPLLVVLVATILSNRVHNWIASGRSASLNVAEMSQIVDELFNLRPMKPGIEHQDDYRAVQRLLAAASRQQERGDVSGAAATLAEARQKLDTLIAGSGIPAGAVAMGLAIGRRTIIVETPLSERTTGRVLTFRISGPFPAGAVVWKIGVEGEWRTLDVKNDATASPVGVRVVTQEPIREPGVYAVRLDVGGVPEEPTTFRIERSQTERVLRSVRRTDYSIDLLAAFIAALVTMVAIWELDSFGTFRDYALQFTGAFGITESVKGFAQVLGDVRKV